MHPAWWKLIGSASSSLICLVIGALAQLPIVRKSKKFLSLANTAGGGVILAVAVIHLLPEVAEGFSESHEGYPIGYALILCGYMTLLLLEKVLFSHEHHHHGGNPTDAHGHTHEALHSHTQGESEGMLPANEISESASEIAPHDGHEHDGSHDHNGPNNGAILTPLLLMLSLSVHAVFEGIVLGLQTEESALISLILALISHKPVEALSLGILMVKEQTNKAVYVLFIILFSAVTPLGCCIGMVIGGTTSMPGLLVPGFTAFAIGSFFYIGTTEIIADEFHSSQSASGRWLRYLSLLFGMGFIMVTQIWLAEHHHHDH